MPGTRPVHLAIGGGRRDGDHARRSSATCSKESIGAIRFTPGDLPRRVECDSLTHVADFRSANHLYCAAVAFMATAADHLPDDKDALRAARIEARAKLPGASATRGIS